MVENHGWPRAGVHAFPSAPLRLQELPTQLGRKVLVAEFSLNGQSFAVATSHLEVRRRLALSWVWVRVGTP
jgi:endonuclease/exonuclease/phosphatase family metal-dependent hydrolase